MTAPSSFQKKSAARLYAVQALFQMESSGAPMDQVREEFVLHRFGATVDGVEWVAGNINLFETLLETVVAQQAKIDQLTDRALVAKWPIAKIDPTLRALFRAAGAELVIGKTPPKVVINEYVEITKAFFPEGRESRFVNGVLDHMAREIAPEKF